MTRTVELFVTGGIVAAIVLLSGYAVMTARSHTRDITRLAHVRETQMALEMYFQNHSSYPIADEPLALGQALTACLSVDGFVAPCSANGQTPYLSVVPVPPTAGLRGLVTCADVANVYCYQGAPETYRIQFELESSNAILGVAKGVNCLTEQGFAPGACSTR